MIGRKTWAIPDVIGVVAPGRRIVAKKAAQPFRNLGCQEEMPVQQALDLQQLLLKATSRDSLSAGMRWT